MEQQIPWLNRASFEGRITLPKNFKLELFSPYLIDLDETRLPKLLGAAKYTELVAWVNQYPYGVVPVESVEDSDTLVDVPNLDEVTSTQEELYKLVQAYLVYAVYAEYLLKGDVQNTDVGPLLKDNQSSTPLSDTRIAQLYRNYQSLADERAVLITDFVRDQDKCCTASIASSGPRFTSSRGRTKSVFD